MIAPRPLTSAELDEVRHLVSRRAAIVLDVHKNYLIESRLTQLARSRGFGGGAADVVAALKSGVRGIDDAVVEAMTTHETSFFRDRAPFELLRDEALPRLMEKRAIHHHLSIWSAASSFGQEAVSISILIEDQMPQLTGWKVRVFGSDLSSLAVARARRFRFSDLEVQRGLTPQQLKRHFRQVDDGWELVGAARERLSWFQMNLMDTWSLPARPDVIFMRNVLIYFDTPTKKRMIERARQALAADGFLFLGGAETPMQLDDDGWERITKDKSSCYLRRP